MERRVDREKVRNHFLQRQQRCARLQLLFHVSLILVNRAGGGGMGWGLGGITPLREGRTLRPHALGSGGILCGVCVIFLRLRGFSPGFLPQPKHLHSRPGWQPGLFHVHEMKHQLLFVSYVWQPVQD